MFESGDDGHRNSPSTSTNQNQLILKLTPITSALALLALALAPESAATTNAQQAPPVGTTETTCPSKDVSNEPACSFTFKATKIPTPVEGDCPTTQVLSEGSVDCGPAGSCRFTETVCGDSTDAVTGISCGGKNFRLNGPPSNKTWNAVAGGNVSCASMTMDEV